MNHQDDTCPYCGHEWRWHDLNGCRYRVTPADECNCTRWNPYPHGYRPSDRSDAGSGWLYAIFGGLGLAGLGALVGVMVACGCG